MIRIRAVEPGSIAEELEIFPGDYLLKIDGKEIRDYIDYQYGIAADFFVLTVEKADGEIWEIEIEKDADESIGLVFDDIIFDQLKLCKNNCLFCFVRQQPGGLRKSLLLKDDDYRFSFLQGSFITLTNLKEEDFKRIVDYNLSPLYISVHTTNPALRVEMMKNPQAGRIMEQLKYLAERGISYHTQLVLCPGYNDGTELDRSIKDLISLYPNVLSIGVVPVGLTEHRFNLPFLEKYTNSRAKESLAQVKEWQKKIKDLYGKNILYAADEFYFLANDSIPPVEEYHDFCQLENGIGLTRLLWEEFASLSLPESIPVKTVGLITGILGNKALAPIVNRLQEIPGLDIYTIPVENEFFGSSVTVTGLLTGQDIINKIKQLSNKPEYIIIPDIVLNPVGLFLDNLTVSDLIKEFPELKIYFVANLEEMLEVLLNG
ncbi:MAG TPA: DUF512 domain-containing protein [Halanaerobiaceae bacterium]|jgi:putative radical SAM enzyme (TIGR03279 family)|nr:DUF512 domain-containing protein [Bacillota bacterium]HHU93020.1 DUF512 domain-containing protein [Halanaerobiaceae bacterium]HOA40212.1 DUF512 domain-containing protein [Halanaerobiales bacterium]HPZ62365.1 DUF512 domain-containing protein [Halanaerobiales bacterium]HQD03763.1 DUF512 domain-containing protein [Halanaerobiales bacterium]